jgi:putative tryptophan/tyrosine transport system substrate-binding protein
MQFDELRRRDFVTLLGGAAVAWPVGARGQQQQSVRRIGVLMNLVADDPAGQTRLTRFLQKLQELGWSEGRNARIDIRWGAGDALRIRQAAAELVGLAPDVILASGSPTAGPLLQATRVIPIVFVQVADPIGAGFVDSLAHPGANATGFSNFEYATTAKWLELLKQIAPKVTRVAVLRDPLVASGPAQLAAIQMAAGPLSVELSPITLASPDEIERAIAVFARGADGGIIVTAGSAAVHRKLLVTLARQHRLPATYSDRVFVADGGLISYGPDRLDQYPRAAAYVDRILRGEKPTDLPVQAPTKYELAINLKTAKALGLEVPATLLARADEIIE